MNTTRNLDLVGMPEIAERLGATLQTVQSWRKRAKQTRDADPNPSREHRIPMPEPEWTVAAVVPVWRWETIRAWAEATGRLEASR